MRRALWSIALLALGLGWAQVDPSHVAQAVRRTIQIGGGWSSGAACPNTPWSSPTPSRPNR